MCARLMAGTEQKQSQGEGCLLCDLLNKMAKNNAWISAISIYVAEPELPLKVRLWIKSKV